jgi:hypothetical protein
MVGVPAHVEATQTLVKGQGSAEVAGAFHDAEQAGEMPGLLGSQAEMGTRSGRERAAWHDARRTTEDSVTQCAGLGHAITTRNPSVKTLTNPQIFSDRLASRVSIRGPDGGAEYRLTAGVR